MKKCFILIVTAFILGKTDAQLLVVFQSPPVGFTYKPQLWPMIVTNTGNSPLIVHMELTLQPANSSQQVLSAVTRQFTLLPGTNVIEQSMLTPIQYNIVASTYSIDPNPYGLLPLGNFEACYQFFQHKSDFIQEIAEQCQEITVAPLSPAQLVYPYDQVAIEETNPEFSWLPPIPVQLFTDLKYDLTLVEISPNQSAADAIQQNVPIYQAINLAANSLLYPLSASALQYDKQYAWRVMVKSNGTEAGPSETWQFKLKHFNPLNGGLAPQSPYVELKKDAETAYAIFTNEIKFTYYNETSDTAWHIKINDLSLSDRPEKLLDLDSTLLQRGRNMVKYDARNDSWFMHKHLYQLEILNSRKEVWRVRFEYRISNEQNN
jgi:hypothetical protein